MKEKFSFFANKICIGLMYGISFPITIVILDYWLKDCGVSLTTIGLFSLFHAPFMMKFLWAPIIDRYEIPYFSKKLGQRKSWGILSQFFLILGIIGLSQCNPATNLITVIFFSSLVAFSDGCINIALYPYQIHKTEPENIGYVAGMINLGHRIGMIFSKVSALYIADIWNWEVAYLSLAGFVFICLLGLLKIDEPRYDPPRNYLYLSEFLGFFQNHKRAITMIAILILYRALDYFSQKMGRVFCLEIGFSKTEIAHIVQFFGSIAAVIGGIFAGYLVKKEKNVYDAMFLAGLAHMFTVFSYVFLAHYGYNVKLLCTITLFESLTRGCTTAIFLAFIYTFCHSGSMYALTWAIHELGGIFFASISGIAAELLGWQTFFALAPIVSIPSLIILWSMSKKFKS